MPALAACSSTAPADSPDAMAEVQTDTTSDITPDVDAGSRNQCVWAYVTLGSPISRPCAAGQECRLDVGTGVPDAKYRVVYCETASKTANCGDLFCDPLMDWVCVDAVCGICVTKRAP